MPTTIIKREKGRVFSGDEARVLTGQRMSDAEFQRLIALREASKSRNLGYTEKQELDQLEQKRSRTLQY
jgi:hypothetical protein